MSFDRSISPVKLRARTRAALGQLVGDVLSAQLGALESRLSQRGWLVRPGAGSDAGGRLREVLDRDRALLAAQPDSALLDDREELAPAAQAPAPVETSSALAEPSPAPVRSEAPAPVLTPEDGAEDTSREPIRTRTMAKLLAAQGYHARALAIYQVLLAESPGDAELQAEIERLRAQPA